MHILLGLVGMAHSESGAFGTDLSVVAGEYPFTLHARQLVLLPFTSTVMSVGKGFRVNSFSWSIKFILDSEWVE